MTTKNKIRHKLNSYEEILDNFNRVRVNNANSSKYSARSVLKTRLEIDKLLENNDSAELYARFGNLEEEFKKEIDSDFVKIVKEELDASLEIFESAIDHFLELDPVANELANDLDIRDSIEVLSLFLLEQEEYDYRDEIKELDERFRDKYRANSNKIREFKQAVSKNYLGDNFWWRHPEKVNN